MSVKSHRNHKSSAVVSTSARYSALVLDRETTICFLLCQEMERCQVRNNSPWWSDGR
jgi:hypothetical protein